MNPALLTLMLVSRQYYNSAAVETENRMFLVMD